MTEALAALSRLISSGSNSDKAAIDALLPDDPWTPNPGPQTQALHTRADILLYGGAAGGGKSAVLIGTAALHHRRSAIFRRESTEVDGLVDYSREVLAGRGSFNGTDKEWSLDDGRSIKFGGMAQPDDWRKYAGRARDFMGFDEAGEFLEEQVASIIAWNRTATPGQRCRVVLASNPPRGAEGAWLIDWFAPWLDPLFSNPAVPGELRWTIMVGGKTQWVDGPGTYDVAGEPYMALSRTFIPAKLVDNPFNNTPEYRARLTSLPEPLRSQLLYGDFLAGKQDHERQVIPSAWIEAAQARWKPGRPQGRSMLAIGVDVAQGGADETVLSPLYGTWFAEQVVRPGVETKDGPSVAALVVQHMRDRCQVTIDLTGGWGGSARDHLRHNGVEALGVVFSGASAERTIDQRFGFLNIRSQLWWRFREALDPSTHEQVALPPDRKLAAELAAPTWTLRGDRILIEAKEDIRKRLGSSTDRADGAILAWHDRHRALFMQKHGDQVRNGAWAYAAPVDPFEIHARGDGVQSYYDDHDAFA